LAKKTGSLYQYLFGSILTVTNYYLILIFITALIVALLFILFGKQILAVSFDETTAKFLGVNVSLFQFVFMVVLSMVVSVLLESVGVLLISSMMIIPVAAAMRFGWSYKSTLIISIIFSELSILLGLWMAYSFIIPSGAAIVSINILILLVVSIVKKIYIRKNLSKLDKLK